MDTKAKPPSYAETLLRNRQNAPAGEEPDTLGGASRPHTGQDFMLEFRLRNGNSEALGYSYLSAASFDASGVIRLRFASVVAVVEGRNLRTIYDRILQHRQAYITEQNQAEAALADNAGSAVVTRIKFEAEGEEPDDDD